MSTIDGIARESSKAIHQSTMNVSAPLGALPGAVVASGVRRTFTYAIAGAAAGMVAVFALLVIGPADLPPTISTVPTTLPTVPTSIPGPATPTTMAEAPPVTSSEAPNPIAGQETPTALADTRPPDLVVLSPSDGEHLESKLVTFEGTIEPGADLVASGKFPVTVDRDGAWAIELVLSPGGNGVVFEAMDAAGNSTVVRMTVFYDAETTTTTKSFEYPFKAYQTYGSCAEPIAYDVFYGKANPGATITVSSEYGGGSTTADEAGHWELTVQFPSAPFDKVFTVAVRDDIGRSKTFSFVSKYSG